MWELFSAPQAENSESFEGHLPQRAVRTAVFSFMFPIILGHFGFQQEDATLPLGKQQVSLRKFDGGVRGCAAIGFYRTISEGAASGHRYGRKGNGKGESRTERLKPYSFGPERQDWSHALTMRLRGLRPISGP
jgi:hypothetical protein